jgi:hypothetical protein
MVDPRERIRGFLNGVKYSAIRALGSPESDLTLDDEKRLQLATLKITQNYPIVDANVADPGLGALLDVLTAVADILDVLSARESARNFLRKTRRHELAESARKRSTERAREVEDAIGAVILKLDLPPLMATAEYVNQFLLDPVNEKLKAKGIPARSVSILVRAVSRIKIKALD